MIESLLSVDEAAAGVDFPPGSFSLRIFFLFGTLSPLLVSESEGGTGVGSAEGGGGRFTADTELVVGVKAPVVVGTEVVDWDCEGGGGSAVAEELPARGGGGGACVTVTLLPVPGPSGGVLDLEGVLALGLEVDTS